MSRSGVGLSPECVSTFETLKLGRGDKLKYIVYKLSNDNRTIVVEKTSKDVEYESFIADLPENDCRYAVYDFDYDTEEGKRSKICFYTWSPDTAPVRSKMVYASSKDALRRSLNGIAAEVQGTDFSEVAQETVLEKVSKGKAT